MITTISLITVSLILILSLYYNYKFAMIILNTQEAIEQSLDVLDERYSNIQKLIDTPILYDSPQIKRLVSDIKATRDSILMVANVMTNNTEDSDG